VSEKAKRRLEFSITAVFVLALLLVGAVLIFSGGTASAEQVATLDIGGGVVEVQSKGSDAFRPGIDEQSLHEGDTVRTGPGGRASIEYFDRSETRLDHDTTFTLMTLETLANEDGSKVIQGEQGSGNSYNRVAEVTDSESRFEVETPTAMASVQGTVYALMVDNGATTVAVLDGVVKTTGDGGSVSVPAGRMVVVDTGGSVGAVQEISDDMLSSDWLSHNLCDVDHDAACVRREAAEPSGKPEKESKNPTDELHTTPPFLVTTSPAGGAGVDGPPPSNASPTAGFSASPLAGPAPLSVRFHDKSSDPDGDQISRHWSFGDGSSQDGGTGPTHTFDDPGTYTVTLTVEDPDGATDVKSKVIEVDSSPPGFDHIVISPSNATIQPGGSQNYTAEAFDTDGHSIGNVTGSTSFSIGPDGSCNGNTCTANQPGNHTVTGSYSGDSDTASLVVEQPPPPPCPNYVLAFRSRPPASIDAGRQFNVQIRVDVLKGGSNDGPLTISLSLSGGGFSGGDTSVSWTGQGTVTFNHLTIDQPGSYSITANAPCASSTDAASITVKDGGSDAALGLVLLTPGVVVKLGRARRRLRVFEAAGYAPAERVAAATEGSSPSADAPEG
jgi:PKD repeat protein